MWFSLGTCQQRVPVSLASQGYRAFTRFEPSSHCFWDIYKKRSRPFGRLLKSKVGDCLLLPAAENQHRSSTQTSQREGRRFRNCEIQIEARSIEVRRRIDVTTDEGDINRTALTSRNQTCSPSNRGLSPGGIQAAAVVPSNDFKRRTGGILGNVAQGVACLRDETSTSTRTERGGDALRAQAAFSLIEAVGGQNLSEGGGATIQPIQTTRANADITCPIGRTGRTVSRAVADLMDRASRSQRLIDVRRSKRATINEYDCALGEYACGRSQREGCEY